MRITFLGTAAGVPEKNRACASTVIDVGGRLYLIDAGMSVVNRLIDNGFDIEALRSVFITHTHSDHVLGLIDLVRCVNIEKIFPKAEIDYYSPDKILNEAIDDFFNAVISPIRKDVNRFHTYKEGVIFDDGVLKVSAVSTAHTNSAERRSFAFLVEGDGRRVVFSGDLSQKLASSDIPLAVYESDIDLFVLEFAHFSLNELEPHLDGMTVKKLVFNHVSRFEEKKSIIEEFKKKNPKLDIACSFDGYSIEL